MDETIYCIWKPWGRYFICSRCKSIMSENTEVLVCNPEKPIRKLKGCSCNHKNIPNNPDPEVPPP